MATALRPVGHEDRLSLVEHLDELRSRLIICGRGVRRRFALCWWQNDRLLTIVNKPLQETTRSERRKGRGPWARSTTSTRRSGRPWPRAIAICSDPGQDLKPAQRAALGRSWRSSASAADALKPPQRRRSR